MRYRLVAVADQEIVRPKGIEREHQGTVLQSWDVMYIEFVSQCTLFEVLETVVGYIVKEAVG